MYYLVPVGSESCDLSSVEGWAMDSDIALEATNCGLVQLENGNFVDQDGVEWEIIERNIYA